jgi:hypothetical protein
MEKRLALWSQVQSESGETRLPIYFIPEETGGATAGRRCELYFQTSHPQTVEQVGHCDHDIWPADEFNIASEQRRCSEKQCGC